jgi:hypothetical protein
MKRADRRFDAELARHRDSTGFSWVMELTMTTVRPHDKPAQP